MEYLIAERAFETPLSDEELQAYAAKLQKCYESHNVRWLRSFLSADCRRMVCEYQAADAEAVRSANRTAGAPFERVWAATLLPGTHGGA